MKNIKIIIVIFVIISLFVLVNKTYSYLYSNVDSNTNITLGRWNISLNGENITSTYNDTISFDDVTWVNTHANSNKVAPGSTGTLEIEVDPSDTDVAVRFDLSYTDKTVDSDKILTITNVSLGDLSLIHTASNTYTGVFSLEDIDDSEVKTIIFTLAWINDENNNDADSQIGLGIAEADLVEFHFVASQYNGEPITPIS